MLYKQTHTPEESHTHTRTAILPIPMNTDIYGEMEEATAAERDEAGAAERDREVEGITEQMGITDLSKDAMSLVLAHDFGGTASVRNGKTLGRFACACKRNKKIVSDMKDVHDAYLDAHPTDEITWDNLEKSMYSINTFVLDRLRQNHMDELNQVYDLMTTTDNDTRMFYRELENPEVATRLIQTITNYIQGAPDNQIPQLQHLYQHMRTNVAGTVLDMMKVIAHRHTRNINAPLVVECLCAGFELISSAIRLIETNRTQLTARISQAHVKAVIDIIARFQDTNHEFQCTAYTFISNCLLYGHEAICTSLMGDARVEIFDALGRLMYKTDTVASSSVNICVCRVVDSILDRSRIFNTPRLCRMMGYLNSRLHAEMSSRDLCEQLLQTVNNIARTVRLEFGLEAGLNYSQTVCILARVTMQRFPQDYDMQIAGFRVFDAFARCKNTYDAMDTVAAQFFSGPTNHEPSHCILNIMLALFVEPVRFGAAMDKNVLRVLDAVCLHLNLVPKLGLRKHLQQSNIVEVLCVSVYGLCRSLFQPEGGVFGEEENLHGTLKVLRKLFGYAGAVQFASEVVRMPDGSDTTPIKLAIHVLQLSLRGCEDGSHEYPRVIKQCYMLLQCAVPVSRRGGNLRGNGWTGVSLEESSDILAGNYTAMGNHQTTQEVGHIITSMREVMKTVNWSARFRHTIYNNLCNDSLVRFFVSTHSAHKLQISEV